MHPVKAPTDAALNETRELLIGRQTANNVTPFILGFTDLRKGHVVLEVPAKSDKASLYRQLVDAWQVTIADVGPSDEDKGAGGKYLLLPPGYKKPVPASYFPVQSAISARARG